MWHMARLQSPNPTPTPNPNPKPNPESNPESYPALRSRLRHARSGTVDEEEAIARALEVRA